MSVTRTFTVTVANPGSGNKFYIDSVLQATVNLAENGTYKFDQSDSSNSGHPLRFSTTSDGTHGGGSEYTTGVTTNGTPGSAEAYTQIVVADSAPTLYYYCANHSGMGGQADTPADNTWGMWAWSTNEWGDQGPIAITLSGQSATSSVGSVLASQIITVPLTAPSGLTSSLGSLTLDLTSIVSLTAPSTLTSAVGALDAENQEGWGRQEWGNSGWGVDYAVRIGTTGAAPAGLTSALGSPIAEAFLDVPITAPSGLTSSLGTLTTAVLTPVPLTAPSQMTSELGSFDNAGTLVGWGRNGWGEEPWGDSFNKLIQPSGLSITSSVGAIAPADVMGLTGVSATTSVGSLTLEIVVPLTAPTNLTSSVGAITPADVMGLTGVSATSSIGSITVTEAQLVIITAPSALSTSVGSVNIELVVPLTAPTNLTASVGAINPADVIGITGVEATVSVGGVSPLGYQDVDITGYTSYTDVNLVA